MFSIDACALTELPRGCEYWNDKRMVQLVNGTESHVHTFDGRMYGLTSQYNAKGLPIKKPWKVVSWGVHFKELQKTCDGRHQHVPCAGRDHPAPNSEKDTGRCDKSSRSTSISAMDERHGQRSNPTAA